MQDTVLRTSGDTFLVALPFLALLICGFFRLDAAFASPKRPNGPQGRQPSGVDENGEPILCDPDGRPWRKPHLRQ